MNIFILSTDIIECAQMHVDKHVVKMILETAQLLSTAQRHYGNEDESLYKATHVHHPCTKWTIRSKENYEWLFKLFIALNDEYTFRYGKVHKCLGMSELLKNPPDTMPSYGLTPFATAMPDEYKTTNPVESYRNYYRGAKKEMASWKKRETPYWW